MIDYGRLLIYNIPYRLNNYWEWVWDEFPHIRYVIYLLLIAVISVVPYRLYIGSLSDNGKLKPGKRYKAFTVVKHYDKITESSTQSSSVYEYASKATDNLDLASIERSQLESAVKCKLNIFDKNDNGNNVVYEVQFQDIYLLNSIIRYCRSEIKNLNYGWDEKGILRVNDGIGNDRFKKYKDALNGNESKFKFSVIPRSEIYSIVLKRVDRVDSELTGIQYKCLMGIFRILMDDRPSNFERIEMNRRMNQMMDELERGVTNMVRSHLTVDQLESLNLMFVKDGNDDQDDVKEVEVRRMMIEKDNEPEPFSLNSEDAPQESNDPEFQSIDTLQTESMDTMTEQ